MSDSLYRFIDFEEISQIQFLNSLFKLFLHASGTENVDLPVRNSLLQFRCQFHQNVITFLVFQSAGCNNAFIVQSSRLIGIE